MGRHFESTWDPDDKEVQPGQNFVHLLSTPSHVRESEAGLAISSSPDSLHLSSTIADRLVGKTGIGFARKWLHWSRPLGDLIPGDDLWVLEETRVQQSSFCPFRWHIWFALWSSRLLLRHGRCGDTLCLNDFRLGRFHELHCLWLVGATSCHHWASQQKLQ